MIDKINEFLNIVSNSKNIAIITHANPDGDALGSALMMYEFLTINFKNVEKHIYTENKKITYEFQKMLKDIKINEELISPFDCAVVVDCAGLKLFEKYNDLYNSCPHTIVFDHHPTNQGFAQLNFIGEVSSTCEYLYSILIQTGLGITKKMLEYCTVGIMTDTNALSIPNVTYKTYQTMSEISKFGVDVYGIRELFYNGNEYKKYNLLGYALSHVELYFDGKVMFIHIPKTELTKLGATAEDMNGVINQSFCMQGAVACFLVYPKDDYKKISMRSKLGIDVSILATKFGGGGHVCASASNSKLSLKKIKEEILSYMQEALKSYTKPKQNFF